MTHLRVNGNNCLIYLTLNGLDKAGNSGIQTNIYFLTHLGIKATIIIIKNNPIQLAFNFMKRSVFLISIVFQLQKVSR